jgi:hypothetical protein
MLTAETNNRDHLVNLCNTQVAISELKSATEILHSLVHSNGDESHLKWMADKLLNDASDLSERFSKEFGAHVAALREPYELPQAAE